MKKTAVKYDGSSVIIAPSLLASDFAKLAEEAARVEANGADWLHLDIMDGHFVPNISFGAPVVKCLRRHATTAFFDCHLMVSSPEQWISSFKEAGADLFTFHFEAAGSPEKAVEIGRTVGNAGMRAGLSLKPKTLVEEMFPALDSGYFAVVLVMTVEPGFGGQSFMPDMMAKVRKLRLRYPQIIIEVDGGLDEVTTKICAEAGANAVVAGTSIFQSENPKATIHLMRELIQASLPSP